MSRCRQPPPSWSGPPPFSSALRKYFCLHDFYVSTLSHCANLTRATPTAVCMLCASKYCFMKLFCYCFWSRLSLLWLLFEFMLVPLSLVKAMSSYCCLKRGNLIIFWKYRVNILLLFLCRCPWLAEDFSSLIPIYVTVIFLFTLANFCMATFMDPGVFPRGKNTWKVEY